MRLARLQTAGTTDDNGLYATRCRFSDLFVPCAILPGMKLVADLHIHSHYSRATSKNLTFEHLARWAQLKGVHVVGTGDIAHPGWLQEMREKLEPAEEGLFRLKAEVAQAVVQRRCRLPARRRCASCWRRDQQHLQEGRPDAQGPQRGLCAVASTRSERLQARLEKIGNIRSDGRPDPGPGLARSAGDHAGRRPGAAT